MYLVNKRQKRGRQWEQEVHVASLKAGNGCRVEEHMLEWTPGGQYTDCNQISVRKWRNKKGPKVFTIPSTCDVPLSPQNKNSVRYQFHAKRGVIQTSDNWERVLCSTHNTVCFLSAFTARHSCFQRIHAWQNNNLMGNARIDLWDGGVNLYMLMRVYLSEFTASSTTPT